jgi:DNA-binding IscR family transcriptional regulator
VVRRILSGLRERGYVRSEKGHGGGWSLDCDFETTTLRDIYAALGSPPLLAIGHRSETSACLVEQAVNAALSMTFAEAEQLLLTRFGAVTLAALSADFHQRLALHAKSPPKALKHVR